MQTIITREHLAPFACIQDEVAEAMIEDAIAQASLAAPCLADETVTLTDAQVAAVRAILRRAILRWHETGVAGTVTTQTAGPFNQTITTTQRGGLFWPSEITDLQAVCKSIRGGSGGSRRAFDVDQIGHATGYGHQPWCSRAWGWPCSCGANLTREEYPLWEGGVIS